MENGQETALAIAPDSPTAFLESNRIDRIPWELKAKCLELFRASGNLTASSKQVGIDPRHIRWHLVNDPAFKKEYEQALAEMTDGIEGHVLNYAARPGNVIDRMAWLRARRPEVWNPDKRIQVDVNVTQVSQSIDRAQAYDAELSERMTPAPSENPTPPPQTLTCPPNITQDTKRP